MNQMLYSLAVLTCPLGMGLMKWMMIRGGDNRDAHTPPIAQRAMTPVQEQDLARLLAEVGQLRADEAAHGPSAKH